MKRALVAWTVLFFAIPAFAQMVEVKDGQTVKTGKERAREYFAARKPASSSYRSPAAANTAPHYLAVHVGSFFSDQAYKWGHGSDQGDVGRLNAGVTYRLGEWTNSMDFAIRAEYMGYSLKGPNEGAARKLSFAAMITFPDAHSEFPLYFGAGIGPGFFIKQLHDESALSLDYQIVAGARFFNVINTMGFMVETGIKNHIFLLSDGQFNGVFLNVGTVFTF